ncbi:MAG: glycine cleavage system protein GcvH [Proteobacteria bacterium]|nr:glycine cleavage system protein GcvH [Pseudomonadota bacterium]
MVDLDDLLFSEDHIWVRLEGKNARIGVTNFLKKEYGEITAVDLPVKGEELEKDAPFGEIESFQKSFDLIAPISGAVLEVNANLEDEPGLIGENPYQEGWLLLVSPADANELQSLLDFSEYQKEAAEEEE